MRKYIQRKLNKKQKITLEFVKKNKCTKTMTAKRISELYKIPLSTVKLTIKRLEKGELLKIATPASPSAQKGNKHTEFADTKHAEGYETRRPEFFSSKTSKFIKANRVI